MNRKEMNLVQGKKSLEKFKFHANILFRGFLRTVCGTTISVWIAIAIYGFIAISKETGWDSVIVFIASCFFLIFAFLYMYVIGLRKK